MKRARVVSVALLFCWSVTGQTLNNCVCFNSTKPSSSQFAGTFTTLPNGTAVSVSTCVAANCPSGALSAFFASSPAPTLAAALTASTCGATSVDATTTDCQSLCTSSFNVYTSSVANVFVPAASLTASQAMLINACGCGDAVVGPKYGAGFLNYNATSLAPLTFSPVGYSTTAYTLTYTGGAPPFAGGAAQCTNSYSMGPYVAPPPVVTSTFTFPVNLSTFDADTISSGVSAAYAGVGTPGAPMVALGVQSTAYASGGVVAPSGVAPSGVAPPDPCAQMVCGGALCGAAVAQFLGMPPHVVIGITMGLSACGGGGVGGIFTPSFDIPPSWQSAGRRSLAQAAGGGGAALYFQVFGLGANATAARAAAAGLSDPAVLNAALAAAGLNTTVTSAPPAVVTAAVSVAVSLPRGASQSNALAALAAVNSGASFSSVLAAGGGAGPATTTNAVPPPAPPPVAPPTPSKAMRARKNPRKGLAPYNDGYDALSLDYWASVGFLAFFGAVLAVLVFLFPIAWFAVWLLRRCCRCGGRGAARGSRAVTPVGAAPPTPSAQQHLRPLRFALLAFALVSSCAVAGGACVWRSGGDIHATLKDQLDGVSTLLTAFLARVASVAAGLTFVANGLQGAPGNPDTSAVTSAVNTLNSTANSVDKAFAKYQPQAQSGLDDFELACTVVGAGFVALVLLCAASAVFRSRRALGASTFVLWCFAILFWVVCGIAYAASAALGDSCDALGGLLSNPGGSGLERFIPCFNASYAPVMLSKAYKPLYSTINTADEYIPFACTPGTPSICNPAAFDASSSLYVNSTASCGSQITLAALVVGDTFDATYNPTTCPTIAAFNASSYKGFVVAAEALVVLMSNLTTVANCSYIFEELGSLRAACPAARSGVRLLFAGLLLAVASFTLLLLLSVHISRVIDANARAAKHFEGHARAAVDLVHAPPHAGKKMEYYADYAPSPRSAV